MVKRRAVKTGLEDDWCVPNVTSQIAREYVAIIGEQYAKILAMSIQRSLQNLYDRGSRAGRRQAYIWAKYEGIDERGERGDRWTFSEIAAQLGVTREYVNGLYLAADSEVMRAVVLTQHRVIESLTK